jgi:DNA polymerase III alpha subunit
MLTKTNTEHLLIKGILLHGPSILENCIVDADTLREYADKLNLEYLNYPKPVTTVNTSNWFIPEDYKSLDIEELLVHVCPEQNYNRLVDELALFKKHNMIPVLRTMKYIVDTLRENNVVWGVGRGSSVASYVLFLLGVHKVDSIKYNLPIEEFFKEV